MSTNNACDHTPGPWTVDLPWALKNSGHYIVMAENTPIADCGPNRASNARLIAAAPELLEALQIFLEWFESGKNESLLDWKKLRATLAKATGGHS